MAIDKTVHVQPIDVLIVCINRVTNVIAMPTLFGEYQTEKNMAALYTVFYDRACLCLHAPVCIAIYRILWQQPIFLWSQLKMSFHTGGQSRATHWTGIIHFSSKIRSSGISTTSGLRSFRNVCRCAVALSVTETFNYPFPFKGVPRSSALSLVFPSLPYAITQVVLVIYNMFCAILAYIYFSRMNYQCSNSAKQLCGNFSVSFLWGFDS